MGTHALLGPQGWRVEREGDGEVEGTDGSGKGCTPASVLFCLCWCLRTGRGIFLS